jgi:hypothetical protein
LSYETELIIGLTNESDDFPEMFDFIVKHGRGVREIARVELSSTFENDEVSKLIRQSHKEADERFAKNGDHFVIYTDVVSEDNWELNLHEDKYGARIGVIPLAELHTALLASLEASRNPGNENRGYRRYIVAVATIEAILAEFDSDPGELVALTHGH